MVKSLLVATHGHADKSLKSLTGFDSFNYSPLHTASAFGYSDVINLLLEAIPKEDMKKLLMPEPRVTEEKGSTPNLASSSQKGKIRESPYYLASANGHTASLKLLLEYVMTASTTNSNFGSGQGFFCQCPQSSQGVEYTLACGV